MTIHEAKAQLAPLFEKFHMDFANMSDAEKVSFTNALNDLVTVKGSVEAVHMKRELLQAVQA
ncbi:hypothetical protein P4644_16125 [Priestia aryabhattai]|uniref:hypothetical protein n=1 Tax=Priestia aryabhattai TaxID=412384 RepID=UPI002E1E93FA|nr:hypothetical protein [Priestia aryabhattai]